MAPGLLVFDSPPQLRQLLAALGSMPAPVGHLFWHAMQGSACNTKEWWSAIHGQKSFKLCPTFKDLEGRIEGGQTAGSTSHTSSSHVRANPLPLALSPLRSLSLTCHLQPDPRHSHPHTLALSTSNVTCEQAPL
eukprot:scaffold258498_cov22-Tisochrysis_lutea.AAC.1